MWWKSRKAERAPAAPAQSESPDMELRESGRAPLSEIAKKVKEVELVTRKKSTAILAGQYKSRFKGQGMQFSDFRVYQYGDDTRHIDWRTSARMQETYVKTFEEERELNIFFAVDVSGSGDFGTAELTKREALAIGLACLGFSAINNGDRVGLILFSDRVERFVPPKKGRKHILRIIDEVLSFTPVSKKSKINAALEFLSTSLKNGAVLVLASDFFSPVEKKMVDLLSRKHDFICLRATDARDLDMPNVGLLRVEDPETGESLIVNTASASFRKQYSDDQKAHRAALEQALRKGGAELLDIFTHDDPSRILRSFFHSRKRRKR